MFRGFNVWALLQLQASRHPDRPALVWNPFVGDVETWTYARLARDVASLAAGMQKRGIESGDRVVIHLENCPEFVVAWYACAATGAVAVTTNTRSTRDELLYYAGHCGPAAIITQPRLASLVASAAPTAKWVATTELDAGESLGVGDAPDRSSSFVSLFTDPNELERFAPDPLAPMSIQYTSGTTSRPKGVVWTHANAMWAAKVNAVHEDLHPSDCHLCYMPLFHTNALAYSMLASLWVGARFVLLPKWSTNRFWDISRRHRCTWLSLMGLSARALASLPPEDHTYRFFGAGVCDVPWAAALGVKTIGWWGMTETVSHGIVGDPFTPNRPYSMGRPAPEYGIAVVRPDGTSADPEETGHLLVRGIPGLSLFAEYLNDPQSTAESFDEDGWFSTGDRVTLHEDGHISFADRSKDMLKVGAENVAASEIERVLLKVGGVSEAAVVGRSDPKLDEVPVAFVVSDGTDAELPSQAIVACRAQLAEFKVPVEVFVVQTLPRSTLSKIDKVALRAAALPGADLAAAEGRWCDSQRADPSGEAI